MVVFLVGNHRNRVATLAQRRGFTLVELLVVIAIIGILVSLLLPAVQAAREAVRRIKCQHHLRQLALGVTHYHDTHGAYPASGLVDTSSRLYDPRSGTMHSWITLILPYLEQRILYDQFDFHASVLAQSNDPQAVQPPVLLCPSDSARHLYFVDPSLTGGRRLGKGNYAAWVSPYHVEFQARFPAALTSHDAHSASRLSQDGHSTTMMLSEVLTRGEPADQRGAWAIAWTGAAIISYDLHHDGAVVFSETGYTISPLSLGLTQRPNNQGPNLDMLYDCANPADAQLARLPCNTWAPGGAQEYLSAAPRSWHPGGVNVAWGDGHVSFVTDAIDEVAMAYLISVGDGQAVEAP